MLRKILKTIAPKNSGSPFPAMISGVPVRVSSRARRMGLRVDARSGGVILTVPARGVSERAATRFVDENQGWIAKHNAKKPQVNGFVDGARVVVLGDAYTVTHRAGRGVTRFDDDKIIVQGRAEFLDRRMRDFLKKHALEKLQEAAREKAALIGKSRIRVRVADPKSRWGSCGHSGQMMFSWRLILTPADVFDYVVAHEVAHLAHMNHSQKFWDLCYSLCDNGAASKRWLVKNGLSVMVY